MTVASDPTVRRVGFIGLGSQGAPMARRIIEGGYATTLWARRPASLDQFADTSADIAASPAELAAASDLVCLCVVNDADVDEVITGEQGILAGLRAGGIIAVHSTVHPDTCRRLATLAEKHGVSLIDAPVSGGGPGAADGRLLVMVGGDRETVERCRPVFATYGDPIVHIGPIGSGQVTKLLNNVLFTANLANAASLVELGQALDTDPARLAEVLSHGSGSSFALSTVARSGGTLDGVATHAGELLRKDVRLIGELAEAAEAEAGFVMAAAAAALALMNR